MSHLIFVFGTLKQGFPNFSRNQALRVAGEFVTLRRFPLYLVGERCSPWLVNSPGQGQQVTGQLFRADPIALAHMDALERVAEADGYRRLAITVVRLGDALASRLEALAYFKTPGQFKLADARHGPLAAYTAEHAALYRSRALPQPAGMPVST